MAYRAGDIILPSWRNVDVGNGRYVATFILPISSQDLLPPSDYCDMLEKTAFAISKAHSTAAIWVQVDSPGLWYALEVRRGAARIARVPIAVTKKGNDLRLADFSNFRPYIGDSRLPPPASEMGWTPHVDDNALAWLRVLSRLQRAMTSEIASLAGFSITTARDALKDLATRDYIHHVDPKRESDVRKEGGGRELYSDEYAYWVIRRNGTVEALRSWNVSPGLRFSSRVEADHGKGESNRHKKTSRLWLASLKKSVGALEEIWTGWTEVKLPNMLQVPDALAWGRKDSRETLYWLEVDSSHLTYQETGKRISRRLRGASIYASGREVNLVFAVLTEAEGARNALEMSLMDVEPHVGVIIADWENDFGQLPVSRLGLVVRAAERQDKGSATRPPPFGGDLPSGAGEKESSVSEVATG